MALTSAEKQAAYRARKNDLDTGKPWEGLQAEEREQGIRGFYGYGKSERLTQAERQAAADRIKAKLADKQEAAFAQEVWRRAADTGRYDPVRRKPDTR